MLYGEKITCSRCDHSWIEAGWAPVDGAPCTHRAEGGVVFQRESIVLPNNPDDPTEEIPVQPYPEDTPRSLRSAAEVLRELQDRLGENHLPDFELAKLFEDPAGYLASVSGSFETANEIMLAVVKLYFQTLHAKATAGEDFGEGRVLAALKKARAVALETLADNMPRFNHAQLLQAAELVSKD